MMKTNLNFDKYDLMLEILGYGYPGMKLFYPELITIIEFRDVFRLLKSLKKTISVIRYKLYLHYDDFMERNREKTCYELHEILNYTNEEGEEKIREAEKYFKAELLEGNTETVFLTLYKLMHKGMKVTMEFSRMVR